MCNFYIFIIISLNLIYLEIIDMVREWHIGFAGLLVILEILIEIPLVIAFNVEENVICLI